jgi:hypothetical protein
MAAADEKVVEMHLPLLDELIIFHLANFHLLANHHADQLPTHLRPAAPAAAFQQYPPSRIASTPSRITLRLSGADSTT